MKVVINGCYGGFSISYEAAKFMADLGDKRAIGEVADYAKQLEAFEFYKKNGKLPEDNNSFRASMFDIQIKYNSLPTFHGYGYTKGMDGGYERDSAILVKAVEELGEKANGAHASLRVVEIPDGTDYEIDEYDGMEHVAEKHQTWS